MDRTRLERKLRTMMANNEPVVTLTYQVKNWIVAVDSEGVTLRSERAVTNSTRSFTWAEIESPSRSHGCIKDALRELVD